MAMNNSSNLVKYPGSLQPTKISFPHDQLHSVDKLDFSHITKHDPKFAMDSFNDIFSGNLSSNPSMNPLMDRNNPNADFFLNHSNNPNMPIDSSLLYGFQNMNQASQSNPNASMQDPNSMYQQNRNMMFQGGMPNQPSYEDLMKSANPTDLMYLNQLMGNDKNLLGSNVMPENMGFLDRNNQFMLSGIEQELAQSGPMPFQNQFLLNNLYGNNEFNLPNFFMQGMPGMSGMPGMPGMSGMSGINFEDLYNLQMQGGMQNPNMPGPFGGMQGQNGPNNAGNQGYPQGNQGPGGQQGGRQMAKMEMGGAGRQMNDLQGNWNPQGGMGQANMPNFGGYQNLKVEGNSQHQKMQAAMKQQGQNQGQSQGNPNMQKNGNININVNANANASRPPQNVKTQGQAQVPLSKTVSHDTNNTVLSGMNQPMKPLMPTKSEPPARGQPPKPGMYGPGPMVKAQEGGMNQAQPLKQQEDNQKPFSMWPEGMPPELAKMAQSAPGAMMKANSMMGDFGDLLGKGMFDPGMMEKMMKEGGMDPFGLGTDMFMAPQMDVYSKLKEKNKYERSLKIERYKNKKRNWQKKIAYECRRRVANTRLRIKGRFISKKECEKIYEFVGEQDQAFNDKKNLNLDYITSKLKVYGEEDDDAAMIAKKFSVSKNHILNKIDDIINHKKQALSTNNLSSYYQVRQKVGSLLMASKKIFKLEKRGTKGRNPEVAMKAKDSGSNSVSSSDRKQNSETRSMDLAEQGGFISDPSFEFNAALPVQPGNEEGEETPMGYNGGYFKMNPEDLDRMIAQDERLANVPREMLEAMMYNMMQSNGMGMFPNNVNMGVGSSGR